MAYGLKVNDRIIITMDDLTAFKKRVAVWLKTTADHWSECSIETNIHLDQGDGFQMSHSDMEAEFSILVLWNNEVVSPLGVKKYVRTEQ